MTAWRQDGDVQMQGAVPNAKGQERKQLFPTCSQHFRKRHTETTRDNLCQTILPLLHASTEHDIHGDTASR